MHIWKKKIPKGAGQFIPTHIPSPENCTKSRTWSEMGKIGKEKKY